MVLTDGMIAFLVTLTQAQRERFNTLPTKRRAWILAPHALGFDRIMGKASVAELSPPPPPPPPITSVAEAIDGIEQRNPTAVAVLAELLTQQFDDRKSWRFYRAVAERVWSGAATAELLREVYRQATQATARNRGAMFATISKRLGLVGQGGQS
jgi:hypothetical protein